MMLAMALPYITFIMLRFILSFPSFIRTFFIKWYWIISKAFSASIEKIKWFLSLLLLICCIRSNDWHTLNHPYITDMKPTWSCVWSFWYAVEFGLPLFYWGFFLHLCSLKRLSYNFLFFLCPYLALEWV
jgi:hypothetical protein